MVAMIIAAGASAAFARAVVTGLLQGFVRWSVVAGVFVLVVVLCGGIFYLKKFWHAHSS